MFLKKRLLVLVLSLVLSIPAISFAENELEVISSSKSKCNVLHDENVHIKKQEIPEEIKDKIKELKEKLKKGEIDKEQFHEEMHKLFPKKPDMDKKGSFHELPEETKVKLKELKDKLIKGEITEKQFQEEVEKILPKKELPKRINPKKFKKESIDKNKE